MAFIILSQPPMYTALSKEPYKRFLRRILNKSRGPSGVTSSLIRGLDELSYPYKLNPSQSEIDTNDTIWVNESLDALAWAISKKKEGGVLIVGPNLVITPNDNNKILCNPAIDIILQPSEWTKAFMISGAPDLQEKIRIWPAGVMVPEMSMAEKKLDVLIYSKNNMPDNLLTNIKSYLKDKGLAFEIIEYGRFKQSYYFEKLKITKALIYLSHSESQGLALHEAWARNVPSLVFNRGYYEYDNKTFSDEKISAPYLNEQVGMFFNQKNFIDKFSYFFEHVTQFQPRKYIVENLSDKMCAQKFIDIIGEQRPQI